MEHTYNHMRELLEAMTLERDQLRAKMSLEIDKAIYDVAEERDMFAARVQRFMTLDVHDSDIRDELWSAQHDTPDASLLIHDAEVLEGLDRVSVTVDSDEIGEEEMVSLHMIKYMADKLRKQAQASTDE